MEAFLSKHGGSSNAFTDCAVAWSIWGGVSRVLGSFRMGSVEGTVGLKFQ